MKMYRLENSPIAYYVEDNGHDQWVMFVHAAFADHNMFHAQVAYFKEFYNIITVDIIGHGASTQTKKGDGIGRMSHWMHEILTSHKIERVHLVGVSLGSVLIQDFANHYPEQVASLSIFGGYDINDFDENMQKENGSGQMLMMLKAIFSIKWFAEDNKKISAYTPKAQQEFYEMNIRFPKKSFMYLAGLNSMVNVHRPSPRNYPLLIGCGAHDIPMELAVVKLWKEKEPAASVAILEGAGHCANMDVPELFDQTLHKFLVEGNV